MWCCRSAATGRGGDRGRERGTVFSGTCGGSAQWTADRGWQRVRCGSSTGATGRAGRLVMFGVGVATKGPTSPQPDHAQSKTCGDSSRSTHTQPPKISPLQYCADDELQPKLRSCPIITSVQNTSKMVSSDAYQSGFSLRSCQWNCYVTLCGTRRQMTVSLQCPCRAS